MLFINIVNRVPDKSGVTIALLVERTDGALFVVDKLLTIEFLGTEQVIELVRLGLLHRTSDLEVRHVLVSYKVDVLDLDFFAPLDREIELVCVGDGRIGHKPGVHIAVDETLLRIEALDDIP